MPTNASARKNLPLASTGKSCEGCPSNLATGKQPGILGRSIGGPVCQVKNLPLARPGVNNERKTFAHFAKDCQLHGVETESDLTPSNKTPMYFTVALPDPTVREPDNWEREAVATCGACANYVPPRIMQNRTGWRTGYCRAKGSLLLDDRLTEYAKSCTDRVFASVSDRLDEIRDVGAHVSIILLAEYGEDFGKPKKVDPAAVHKINLTTKPSDYISDVELKENHKRMGIRAFRRILDPKGYGAPILIPIMDEHGMETVNGVTRSVFTEGDRARIPKSGDPERPESYFDHNGAVYKILTLWLRLNLTPAVWGIAGTGKTELFRHIAWMMGMPFQRISITESSELDDLAGKMLYTPEKGTYFQYGRVPTAWQQPNVLCLDEPNVGPPAVWQFFRALTDNSKQLVLDANKGEAITAHRLSYLGMAMNPAWDVRNSGAYPLADADGSRLMHIDMQLPPADIETQIILEALARDRWDEKEAQHTVATLMRMAGELRALSDNQSIPISWGVRNQLKVARIKRYMTWEDAFRMGVIDALEPAVRELIINVVRSHDDESD